MLQVMRDPALLEECRALRREVEPYATMAALRAAPGWPALEARLQRLLGTPRFLPAPLPPSPSSDLTRVRAVHWNIEHGNEYEQVERALLAHPELRDADLVLLNEVDLGMARAANRDVTADLAKALGLHSVFGALFLELTHGRDDDLRFAARRENQESLFGVAILSRWPITAARILELPSPEHIQFDVERMVGRHIGLVATIDRPGAPFVTASAHLEVHRTRAHRAAQVRVLAEALCDERRPVILAGDFNSHTFDRGLWHAPLAGALALLLTPGGALRRRLLHPDEGPAHEPLFDELRGAGFEWAPFTDHEPTLQLRFDRLDELHALFGPAYGLARRLFARAERRARLRLDWFAGRGWHGGHGSTVPGLEGPGLASDHAPIVAEFQPALPHPAASG
jgi:endonuclease/exonuclease/phosphatase family metal-dependent hydrolase